MGKLPSNRATKAYDNEMRRIINNAPAKREASGRTDGRDTADGGPSQAEKFAKAARELGADQDEDAFKDVVRKLGKPKRQSN